MFECAFNFISNVLFVLDILFTFALEIGLFLYHADQKMFIKKISYKLSRQNMLYVKMFQAISLNNNILNDYMNEELLKFTDSAPYTTTDIDCETLKNIMDKYNLHCDDILQPINSGMISLVYKMKKENGEPIIVKIKRVSIDKKLDVAVEKLLFFIDFVSYIPQLNIMDISNVIKRNIFLLKQQIDFEREVKNTKEMKENCKNLQYIKIPEIYEDITKEFPNAIMMDYIEGVHISKLNDDDFHNFAKLVMKYGFVSIINNSVTHGDLHAGNIIFIKNETTPKFQLGLIDFGIVTRINENTTKTFLEIVSTAFSEKSDVLAKKLLDNIIEPKDKFLNISEKHRQQLYSEASKIIESVLHQSKNANQVKIYNFLKSFNGYINKNNLNSHDLHISDDFVKLQMALAMSQGVSLSLCKNDFIPFANQVLNELFHIDLFLEE
jgi:predicted unusual protein kinase regulating ubiquinone biosynthesis (AarF/ABC1/UbiB family)